jgi:hypothetical protein
LDPETTGSLKCSESGTQNTKMNNKKESKNLVLCEQLQSFNETLKVETLSTLKIVSMPLFIFS